MDGANASSSAGSIKKLKLNISNDLLMIIHRIDLQNKALKLKLF